MDKINKNIDIDTYKILICPFCIKYIPDISFENNQGKINVIIHCICLIEEKQITIEEYIDLLCKIKGKKEECKDHNQNENKYCLHCKIGICTDDSDQSTIKNTSINNELKIYCLEHNQQFKYYCYQCSLNLCMNCQGNHLNHQLIEIKQIDLNYTKELELFEIIMKNKSEKKDSFIKRVLEEIKEEPNKIDSFNQIIIDIESSYKNNHIINEKLKIFHQYLYCTSIIFKDYPYYQIAKLCKTIQPNNQRFKVFPNESILEMFIRLQEDYEESFIIVQEPTNECIATLTGHTDSIMCLIQINDQELITGSRDKTIKLWNLKTLECIKTISGHKNAILCLCLLSIDQFASGSSDKSIKIWNSKTFECVFTLKDHRNWVNCILLLSNGYLASGSRDDTIIIWDLTMNECKFTLAGHTNSIWCLIELNNGLFASSSSDETIKFWEMTSFTCKATLTGHTDYVYNLVQTNNNELASGSADENIMLWNITTGESTGTLSGHSNGVSCLIHLGNGILASSSDDKTIKLWYIPTLECKSTLIGHTNGVYCIRELKNGLLASGSADNTIKLWSIK